MLSTGHLGPVSLAKESREAGEGERERGRERERARKEDIVLRKDGWSEKGRGNWKNTIIFSSVDKYVKLVCYAIVNLSLQRTDNISECKI